MQITLVGRGADCRDTANELPRHKLRVNVHSNCIAMWSSVCSYYVLVIFLKNELWKWTKGAAKSSWRFSCWLKIDVLNTNADYWEFILQAKLNQPVEDSEVRWRCWRGPPKEQKLCIRPTRRCTVFVSTRELCFRIWIKFLSVMLENWVKNKKRCFVCILKKLFFNLSNFFHIFWQASWSGENWCVLFFHPTGWTWNRRQIGDFFEWIFRKFFVWKWMVNVENRRDRRGAQR